MEIGIFSTEGRIRRTTFWLRWLFVFVINIMLRLLFERIKTPGSFLFIGSIMLLLSVFILLQGIKRMHDIDKSGWYFLIPFYNIILALTPGTEGANRYGNDPKGDDMTPFTPTVEPENTATEKSGRIDKIILLFLVFTTVSTLLSNVIQFFIDDWYRSGYKYLHVFMNLCYAAFGIVLATAIRNEKIKIAGILVSIVYALMILHGNIQFLNGI